MVENAVVNIFLIGQWYTCYWVGLICWLKLKCVTLCVWCRTSSKYSPIQIVSVKILNLVVLSFNPPAEHDVSSLSHPILTPSKMWVPPGIWTCWPLSHLIIPNLWSPIVHHACDAARQAFPYPYRPTGDDIMECCVNPSITYKIS